MGEVVPDDGTWRISAGEGVELAGRWWRWVWSAPQGGDPVGDTTGRYAAHDQPDDLWFLAGTYGGRVVRRCEVPTGRPLFFPVLNCVNKSRAVKEPVGMPVARADAHLNGVHLPLEEFYGRFRGPLWSRWYTWGLWGAIAPLNPGGYVLEIKADTGQGFWVDTTYHLTVV
ncbi:hypothetical protein [Nocardiopsis sp. NRRL B-16309]|uniref:hypothetical protein n=1 Tax=Nocardiopsis sp. NRRL B-16309 TaxID=1519494 RepID=UPI0006AE633F|nr:hypothetical protein [Nocardiopsis sp. NRRL B-16309]KOX07309.1 hypothetical protein ADL05_29145 [Nocardiopsis sp. NRRL B-16309]